MKTHIAISSITGGPRIERKAGDTSPPSNLQTVAAGKLFDPRELGIDDAALARMVKRGAVRANVTTDDETPAYDAASAGKK